MLVAVVLDVLIDIWVKRLEPLLSPKQETKVATLDRVRAAEEGARASAQLLTMMIRGLDYLPPVDFEFGDLLDAVLLADAGLCRTTTSGTGTCSSTGSRWPASGGRRTE